MTVLKKYLALLLSLVCAFSAVACNMITPPNSSNSDNSTSSIIISSSSSSSSFDSSSSSSEEDSSSDSSSSSPEESIEEELSIHFLQLGNNKSGDCTLIKTGNTEVLIDAGSTTGSAATIVPYIKNYCTDGVLEYVIVTHGDNDHISALVGSSSNTGVFDSFECKVIIDNALTSKTTQTYKSYVQKRDAEVAAGAKHYTAIDCWNKVNGAQRSYAIGQTITMEILYQKYYETTTTNENNYSVCTLFTQGDNHYLFTGDLEESGESSLVANNTLPKCTLFKAGHHGSDTANTITLLSVIQPEIVVACCCCGDQYGFPHQGFINNVAQYTDKVYVPKMQDKLMNGNIVVSSNGKTVSVQCSNNNTLLKDTEWFKANRTMPAKWAA